MKQLHNGGCSSLVTTQSCEHKVVINELHPPLVGVFFYQKKEPFYQQISVLQCYEVCCSVLQCVEVCCSVLKCVAGCCSVLKCVAVC